MQERQCCQLAKSSLTQGFYDPEDWALGRVSRPLWFTEPNITLVNRDFASVHGTEISFSSTKKGQSAQFSFF